MSTLRQTQRAARPRPWSAARALLACTAVLLPGWLLPGCAGIAVSTGPSQAGVAVSTGPGQPDGAARVLLLGEVHDNPDGHRQRLDLLAARIDAGWRPAIAMEQFDRERQADLDHAMRVCADADCVIQRAGAPAAGWQWPLYGPVIDLALRHRLALLAANVSRADAGRIARQGFGAALDADTIESFGLGGPLPAALAAAQRQEIEQGHCGSLPQSALDGMVRAQVARDVWMARVVSAQAGGGVALLAGNGHVRKDLGVARWLAGAAAHDARSIGFVEQAPPDAAFDEVRRIRPLARPDPCAGLTRSDAVPALPGRAPSPSYGDKVR